MIKRIHGRAKIHMLASKPFLPKHRFHSTKPSANLIGGHAECTQSSISGTQRSSLHLKEIKNKKKNCPSPRYFDTSVSNSNRKKTREYLQETLDTEVGSMKLTEPKAFTNNLNTSHGLPNSHSKSTSNSRPHSNVNRKSFGISNLVYRFFQNETKFLSESLSIEKRHSPEIVDISGLSESIQQELKDQMDDYNRFVVLLSHHPLAVPYQMLLKYYTILPRVLPLDKQALLRTLIFHDAWGDFWSIVLSENATLTDLEETVELIGACLSSNKNTELGIWLALSAAKKEASNNNIYSSIREVFEYKFRISTAKLQLFDRIYATPIDSLADQSSSGLLRNEKLRINQNIDLKAFLIVRFALESENVPLVAQFILEQCQDDPRLHKMPGFVSMALLKTLDMHLVDFFATRRSTMRNERDLYHIMRMARPERHYQLYLSFCSCLRKGFLTTDFVINYFVMQTHLVSAGVFISLVKTHYKVLTIENFNKILLSLLKIPEGRQILRTTSRRQHDRFVSLFKKAIHSKHDTRVLLSLVELSSTKGRTCQRKTLKILGPQKDYIEQLLGYNFTEYNLTEIWRYGIRQNILDSSNTGKLFQKTISRSWNAKELTKRSRNSQETSMKNGFREQFRHATFEEKRRLKVRLQAMAQALSVVEASQISMTLNYLRAYLLEGNHGSIIQDQFAKKYIFHHFIKYTMKFIHRSGERGERISKMRAVLMGLDFDCLVTQASIFESMTMDKPKIALDILENYKKKTSFLTRPIMSGIEKAILTSKLEKQERLSLFQEFQETKARLGYSVQVNPGTMVLMGNLIFDLANKVNDKDELKELIRLAFKNGVPVKIIQKWSAKL